MMIRHACCATTLCCLLQVAYAAPSFAQGSATGTSESGQATEANSNTDSDSGGNRDTNPAGETNATTGGQHQSGADSELKNKTIDGVSALAALVIAAFAVDRFATACMFVLSLIPAFRESFPSPGAAARAASDADTESNPELGKRINRMVYFSFALLAAVFVVWIGQMGILEVLGFKQAAEVAATDPAAIAETAKEPPSAMTRFFAIFKSHHFFDMALTVLILTAGADRVAGLLQLSGASGGGSAEPKPIEITGKLTIDGKTEELIAKVDGTSAPSDKQ